MKRTAGVTIVWSCLLALIGGAVWWMIHGTGAERVEVRGRATSRAAVASGKVREFFQAIDDNKVDRVKQMIAEDATLAKASEQRVTALHQAASDGFVDIAALLIDKGAELEAVEARHHGTPLQSAVVAGQKETVKLLMDRGARATSWFLSLAEQGANGAFENVPEAYVPIAQMLRDRGVSDDGSTRFMHYLRDPSLKMEGATPIQKSWSGSAAPKMTEEGNLLATMSNFGCAATRVEDGVEVTVRLDEAGLLSEKVYTSPITIETVAMTDSTNLRLYFSSGWLIFNWEHRPTELRLVDPATGGWSGAADQGDVPSKQWVTIQWIIGPKEMRVLVDGQERYKREGNYAGIKGRVGIGPAWQSKVTVKSVKVMRGEEMGL